MPAIIPDFNFYCTSVSRIIALEASARHSRLCPAVCSTSQTGTWDRQWVTPRDRTSKTKLQLYHSYARILFTVFRCGIWIFRQFTNGKAHLLLECYYAHLQPQHSLLRLCLCLQKLSKVVFSALKDQSLE